MLFQTDSRTKRINKVGEKEKDLVEPKKVQEKEKEGEGEGEEDDEKEEEDNVGFFFTEPMPYT